MHFLLSPLSSYLEGGWLLVDTRPSLAAPTPHLWVVGWLVSWTSRTTDTYDKSGAPAGSLFLRSFVAAATFALNLLGWPHGKTSALSLVAVTTDGHNEIVLFAAAPGGAELVGLLPEGLLSAAAAFVDVCWRGSRGRGCDLRALRAGSIDSDAVGALVYDHGAPVRPVDGDTLDSDTVRRGHVRLLAPEADAVPQLLLLLFRGGGLRGGEIRLVCPLAHPLLARLLLRHRLPFLCRRSRILTPPSPRLPVRICLRKECLLLTEKLAPLFAPLFLLQLLRVALPLTRFLSKFPLLGNRKAQHLLFLLPFQPKSLLPPFLLLPCLLCPPLLLPLQ
eukprot:Hpha_TRINITY_DN13930_c0_g1::TRINITY_DN13930_c0_g1_i1::g.35310::m.35310